jgi:hypothetical protein
MLSAVTRDRRVARRILTLVSLGLGVASISAASFSLAVFTSSATVASNAFTTGTVVIGASPASALIGYTDMLPGDSVTSALTVSNTGTGQLRYALTSSATNADTKGLKDQLQIVVKTKDTNTAGCANFNGTQLYSGALGSASFGNVAQGADTGDRVLDAATNEVLCFQATLPPSTGNAFQGAATTATFTLSAEQTAHN